MPEREQDSTRVIVILSEWYHVHVTLIKKTVKCDILMMFHIVYVPNECEKSSFLQEYVVL